jgi:hypothetical protein
MKELENGEYWFEPLSPTPSITFLFAPLQPSGLKAILRQKKCWGHLEKILGGGICFLPPSYTYDMDTPETYRFRVIVLCFQFQIANTKLFINRNLRNTFSFDSG